MIKLRYKGGVEGHDRMIRAKGLVFEKGAVVSLPEHTAAHVVHGLSDAFEVVEGIIPTIVIQHESVKKAIAAAVKAAKANPIDPDKALVGLGQLSAATIKALAEKGAAVAIAEGKLDKDLPLIVVWAQVSGAADVLKAAIARAQALREKG